VFYGGREVWHGEAVMDEDDCQTQIRCAGQPGSEKFRVTTELVHVVYNHLKLRAPTRAGGLEKALVATISEYAYEGNVDNALRFIETRQFTVVGMPRDHQAGEYIPLSRKMFLRRRKLFWN
jgi:hypothetical protein